MHPSPRLLLALAPLMLAPTWTATADVSVMSFNVRYDNGGVDSVFDEDGWLYECGPRVYRVTNTILATTPDIFGVQEALNNQMRDLEGELTDYDWYGVGRDDGERQGEYSALFWRKDRFDAVDEGTFWLSETPDEPGTVFEGSGSIRLASWVILDDRATTGRYFVLDTHWDNSCSTCREQSATLVRDQVEALAGDLPIIVMGDLNANESSTALKTLMGEGDPDGMQLLDTYREVYPSRASNEATFHGFDGGTSGSRIDFVLTTADFVPLAAAIDHTTFVCGYPSDHFPVTAVLDEPGVGPAADAPGLPNDPCEPDCTGGGGCRVVPAPIQSTPRPWSLGFGLFLMGGMGLWAGRRR